MQILKAPHPQLSELCKVCGQAPDKEVIDQMQRLMTFSGGVGLSAPQVGINERFFIFTHSGEKINNNKINNKLEVVINPQVNIQANTNYLMYEGCLSIPGLQLPVSRPEWIEVEYVNMDEQLTSIKLRGLVARIFLHEFDHLNGVLFPTRFAQQYDA